MNSDGLGLFDQIGDFRMQWSRAFRGLFSLAVTNVHKWMNVPFHIHRSRSHRFHPHNPNPFAEHRHEVEGGEELAEHTEFDFVNAHQLIEETLFSTVCGVAISHFSEAPEKKKKKNTSSLSCCNDDDGGGQCSEGATRLDPTQSG